MYHLEIRSNNDDNNYNSNSNKNNNTNAIKRNDHNNNKDNAKNNNMFARGSNQGVSVKKFSFAYMYTVMTTTMKCNFQIIHYDTRKNDAKH